MDENKVFIIAEAGVNHNGSVDLAKELIDGALYAKADAIKFQTFNTDDLVLKTAPKARYQAANTKSEGSQYEMIKALELTQDEFLMLSDYCQKKNILFLSTPFDHSSLNFLVNRINMAVIKIASGEITNGPLLWAAAQSQKPIILSTGMSTLADIEQALEVLSAGYNNAYHFTRDFAILRKKVSLLHCTSAYPTLFEEANLKAIQTLSTTFGLRTGYSDHTLGIEASIAAVALGATIIEKHFTLNKTLPGPDHQASLDLDELKSLVTSVRHIEKALGDGVKAPASSELETVKLVRRSLVAKKAIRAGEGFNQANLTAKRPAGGISPMEYWAYLTKEADQHYEQDEVIKRID